MIIDYTFYIHFEESSKFHTCQPFGFILKSNAHTLDSEICLISCVLFLCGSHIISNWFNLLNKISGSNVFIRIEEKGEMLAAMKIIHIVLKYCITRKKRKRSLKKFNRIQR